MRTISSHFIRKKVKEFCGFHAMCCNAAKAPLDRLVSGRSSVRSRQPAPTFREALPSIAIRGRILVILALTRRLAFGALILGAPLLGATSVRAQALPPGSYQQSCTQIH